MSNNRVNKNNEALFDTIEIPYGLSKRQIEIARKLVKERMLDSWNVAEFCKTNGLSSKTYYEWLNDNPAYAEYVNKLQDAVIPSGEREAFQVLKKHLLKIPFKQNPSVKEIELFLDVFGYVAEADKRERMEVLGLNEAKKVDTVTSVEEKKANLLARLKNNTTRNEGSE